MIPFTFVTPTCSADGYGNVGEHLALSAVRDHGADVAVVQYDWDDDRFCQPGFRDLWVHEDVIPTRDLSVVFFLPYALSRFKARRTLSMTMFETDRMPDLWARLVEDNADGMIVPTEHCRRVFSERVSVPVEVAPYGTDTDLYDFCDRGVHDRRSCIFLMSGLLHYRKGVDFALRAFREEFRDGEDVFLWLKTRRNFLDVGDEGETLGDPRVMLIDEDYTRERMRDLYHAADCLLAPSRGEGSGLTPRDAMATGLPVILTDWSGLAELADERYAFPVPVADLETAPQENSSYGTGVTGGGDIGHFARPSIPALRAAMREVYEDRQGALERGRAAAAWMRREFTWEHCAYRWLASIAKLDALVTA